MKIKTFIFGENHPEDCSPYDLTAHVAARGWFNYHAKRDPRYENPYDLSKNGRNCWRYTFKKTKIEK